MSIDEEEQKRGITINSTGATLHIGDWNMLGGRLEEAPATAAATATTSTTTSTTSTTTATIPPLYVGNLPWARDEAEQEQLRGELQAHFARFAAVREVELRPRRGFALVHFEADAAAAEAVAAAAAAPLQLQGREAVVEAKGQSPQQQLAQLCQQRGWAAPELSDERSTDSASGAETLAVHLRIAEADLALSSTLQPGGSLKEARRLLAAAALEQLQSDATMEVASASASSAAAAMSPSSEARIDHGLLINLIDCPGHVDFSSDVTAALRITDGAVVVVDPMDSKNPHTLCPQTDTVLRQALANQVKPVLFLNKIDRAISELQYSPEEAYQCFQRTIDNVNAVIRDCQPAGADYEVAPDKGTVVFGSGLQGWGFSLRSMAELLLARTGSGGKRQSSAAASTTASSSSSSLDASSPVNLITSVEPSPAVAKLMRRLWGEHFFDRASNKWRSSALDPAGSGELLPRGFCAHVLQPIYDIFAAGQEEDTSRLAALAVRLGLTLRDKEVRESTPKQLRKTVMKRWLPVAGEVLHMADVHLPSPLQAQRYRLPTIYEGRLDDPCATAMQACDASGPVMCYITKMIKLPKATSKHLVAFGRVFSGTLEVGQSIRVLGPTYTPEEQGDCFEATVKGLVLLMAGKSTPVQTAPAGAIVGVLGIDKFLAKAGTLTTSPAAHRMKIMQFSVSPVVRMAVTTVKPGDAARLVEAMRVLPKTDPCIQCFVDEATGEKILAGAGELHLEVRLKNLQDLAGVPLRASEPVVQYTETVAEEGDVCMSKSTNKHNRLFVRASPLGEALVADLAGGAVSMAMSANARVQQLAEAHGWARADARRIMAIEGSCILVDATTGISLNDIRDNVVIAFRQLCHNGVLAGEELTGIRFSITDAKIHQDPAHRRADSILPMTRRALSAAFLAASPRLMEPLFAVEVQVPGAHVDKVCNTLKRRRGEIEGDTVAEGSDMHTITALVPVATSFGFADDLRGATHGSAFPQCQFGRWQLVTGDPLDDASNAALVVRASRLRKKMPDKVPAIDHFRDRL